MTQETRRRFSLAFELAARMDAVEPDVLAYVSFPAQRRTKLHSTNPLECLNGEIECTWHAK